ncbi:GNAT family N-acetyltransferase [Aquisalimonas sp. 2447]|uniref:GNAT family N-acetyltransferase n=1 Tax=Aquisalimonas sp. 2447 TaxID=2740807 RepID=UPI00143271F9|nr:GNAT family N-acetyltransferase [Aquisalimonas sp. 2447]QIT54906.1 GNAT family N-acetyltransferase [Aquisalimonas sp. 2447]
MPMADPMDTLSKLQEALDAGVVTLSPCSIHKELGFIDDEPGGTPRFTYVFLKHRQVVAISVFAFTEMVDNVPCFQVGYAVREEYRNAGLGATILAKGIDELKRTLSGTPIRRFFLEAVVSSSNTASMKIAYRNISNFPREITDSFSGEDALQYRKNVECAA